MFYQLCRCIVIKPYINVCLYVILKNTLLQLVCCNYALKNFNNNLTYVMCHIILNVYLKKI